MPSSCAVKDERTPAQQGNMRAFLPVLLQFATLALFAAGWIDSERSIWPLERISRAGSLHPGDGMNIWIRSVDSPDYTYRFDVTMTGRNTIAYVISTGVDCDHITLEGKAHCLSSADFHNPAEIGVTTAGSLFWGTATASLIAGDIFGVAKDAEVVSVRLGGPVTAISEIINALQWILHDYSQRHQPASLLMTYTIPMRPDLASIIDRLVMQANIAVVGHAINASIDTCTGMIHSLSQYITVSGLDHWDHYMEPDTPFGSCIDILAPAMEVPAAVHTPDSNDEMAMLSHTSLGAALVLGVVNCWRSHPQLYRLQVRHLRYLLREYAWAHEIVDVPEGVSDLLLHSILPLGWRSMLSPDSFAS
ncbi:hypothetical protein PYCC9005_001134 [Savitreella phatthalungensis]